MRTNPMEASHPPDEPITRFTITATRDKHSDKVWYVKCPQWNYYNETNAPIDEHIDRIVKEIKEHNEHSD